MLESLKTEKEVQTSAKQQEKNRAFYFNFFFSKKTCAMGGESQPKQHAFNPNFNDDNSSNPYDYQPQPSHDESHLYHSPSAPLLSPSTGLPVSATSSRTGFQTFYTPQSAPPSAIPIVHTPTFSYQTTTITTVPPPPPLMYTQVTTVHEVDPYYHPSVRTARNLCYAGIILSIIGKCIPFLTIFGLLLLLIGSFYMCCGKKHAKPYGMASFFCLIINVLLTIISIIALVVSLTLRFAPVHQ